MRHYHRMDYPNVFGVLDATIRDRDVPGFEPTDAGAYVDWFELRISYLSSTEKAALLIAEGIAGLEGCGGAGPLADSIRSAVDAAVD